MLSSDTALFADRYPLPRDREREIPSVDQRTSGRLIVESYVVAPEEGFELHHHDQDQLAWMRRGAMELSVGGQRWHLRGEHAAWIPAGAPHAMLFREHGDLISVYTDPGMLRDDPAEGARLLDIDRLAAGVLDHLATGDRRSRRWRLCAALLDDVVRDARSSRQVIALPVDPRARAVADALLADPADPRDLAEWASSLGVSTKTIARAFVADTGCTFREWRVRARLQVAVGLLLNGESVQGTALAVGYDAASSFIAAFRGRFGLTPAAYAAHTRGG